MRDSTISTKYFLQFQFTTFFNIKEIGRDSSALLEEPRHLLKIRLCVISNCDSKTSKSLCDKKKYKDIN